jgi:hypothetical protein
MRDAATAVLVVDVTAERPGIHQDISHEVMTATVVADADGVHPAGEIIEIKEMPGEDALLVGGRYVVFIVEYPEDQVPASLINPSQGAYPVRDGVVTPQNGNEVALDDALLRQLGLERPTAD